MNITDEMVAAVRQAVYECSGGDFEATPHEARAITERVAEEFAAALAVQPAEPVAWMYEKGVAVWVTLSRAEAENDATGDITPLYAAPQTARVPQPVALPALLDAVREALPEFSQQDDYMLANGASLMSDNSHEIVHVDTVRTIVRAALAAAGIREE